MLAYTGHLDQARARFRALYQLNPLNVEAWQGALSSATDGEQLARIRTDLQVAWNQFSGPQMLIFRTLRAQVDPDAGRREQTLYALVKESAGQPLRGWPEAGLGYLFFERGSLEAAVDAFTRAIQQTPGLVLARLARGRALLDLGRHQAAIGDLEQYLSRRPSDPIALYNLGWVLLHVRKSARAARPYLERALKILPRDLAILLAVGVAAMGADPPDIARARKCFQDARVVAPDDPDVHLNMGVLFIDHLHNPRAAAAEFRRYIKLGGRRKDRARRWIAELQGKQAP